MGIGLKLRALREERKLSQGHVEERTGLFRSYISRVENGCTIPALETLEKMARALDVPLYMLFFDGPGKPSPLKLQGGGMRSMVTGAAQVAQFEKHMAKMNKRDRNLLLMLATNMAKNHTPMK